MLTRLTLASNGCNRRKSAGDHSMSGKAPRVVAAIAIRGVESKTCKVNAKLREPQTWDLASEASH